MGTLKNTCKCIWMYKQLSDYVACMFVRGKLWQETACRGFETLFASVQIWSIKYEIWVALHITCFQKEGALVLSQDRLIKKRSIIEAVTFRLFYFLFSKIEFFDMIHTYLNMSQNLTDKDKKSTLSL